MSSGALLTEHLPQRPGSRVRHVNRKVIHVHVRAVNLYVERAEIQAHHFTPTRHSNDGNALHCRRFGMHRREVGQGPLGASRPVSTLKRCSVNVAVSGHPIIPICGH
jgi:hypothetical protein